MEAQSTGAVGIFRLLLASLHGNLEGKLDERTAMTISAFADNSRENYIVEAILDITSLDLNVSLLYKCYP
jgi:hypothetical protein